MNTHPNFEVCTFNNKKQKFDDDLNSDNYETNTLNDIGIGVLAEPDQSWRETDYSVAFCLTENNNDAQQNTHDNVQTIYARLDGWSPKTDIDKDDGKFASEEGEEEFRGQPGTVIVKDGNTMIKTTNIDALPGTSGAPLMLVYQNTMDVDFEENVESRDSKTKQRILVGAYQTLSLCVCF